MFVVYVMAFIGAFTAALAGMAYSGYKTSQLLNVQRQQAVETFFLQAKDVMMNTITPRDLRLSGQAQCGGGQVAATDPRSLLCLPEILQLAPWDIPGGGVTDAWGRQIQGVVITERMGIGPGVQAEVTGVALVSAGRDGVVAPNLARRLQTLASSGNSVRQVLALSTQQDIDAGNDPDDIVVTFSNLVPLMNRWQMVERAVLNISDAAQRKYLQDFRNPTIQNRIKAHMAGQLASGITPGQLLVNPKLYKDWQRLNPALVSLSNVQTPAERYALGVDRDFELIESAPPRGTGLRVRTARSVINFPSGSQAFDRMVISLAKGNSPWGDRNGNLAYSHTLEVNY